MTYVHFQSSILWHRFFFSEVNYASIYLKTCIVHYYKVLYSKSIYIIELHFQYIPRTHKNTDFLGTKWEGYPKGIRKKQISPGWCGSVYWAPNCETKGRFNSQSRHTPGLNARSPVGGAREATTHWCFSPSLSPSLPLSKNKYIKSF